MVTDVLLRERTLLQSVVSGSLSFKNEDEFAHFVHGHMLEFAQEDQPRMYELMTVLDDPWWAANDALCQAMRGFSFSLHYQSDAILCYHRLGGRI